MLTRGLTVTDQNAAIHYLRHIGYYRLSGYARPFQKGGTGPDCHHFKPGATFDRILDRYMFDRKLRLVVMDAIELIEIAIRSILSNSVSTRHGPHWYQNASLFNPQFNHGKFIEDIRNQIGHYSHNSNRRDIHIVHYYDKYTSPDMPPCWMIFESVSFGTISIAYKNLIPSEFDPICGTFGLSHGVLTSWLHSISYVRNICAHHGRLWNRECRIKPVVAKAYKAEMTPNDRVYAQLVVMQVLLRKIAPVNYWARGLIDLISAHSQIPLPSMGFPSDWTSRSIWN
jgi:abortive infection bacteriophage resistance protein